MQRIQRKILKHASLRLTAGRAAIVGLFLQENRAFSPQELERSLSGRFDRVTIYRTLKAFLAAGVVHKVLDDSGNLKYALCPESCERVNHHHEHVHFKCIQCGHTGCLEEIPVPGIKLPAGFKAKEYNLLVEGVCVHCQ